MDGDQDLVEKYECTIKNFCKAVTKYDTCHDLEQTIDDSGTTIRDIFKECIQVRGILDACQLVNPECHVDIAEAVKELGLIEKIEAIVYAGDEKTLKRERLRHEALLEYGEVTKLAIKQ